MRLRRARPDDAVRTYLHLSMRPLSAGALEPSRARSGHYTATTLILVGLAVAVVVLAPIFFFLSIFGDPYPRAFVERRADGFYAELRACESDPVHTVAAYPYDGPSEDPDPIWVATQSGTGNAESVRLFSAQPGFDTTPVKRAPTLYEVVINEGRGSESSVVVDERELEVGQVAFGDEPASRADYEAMSDSDFGCPPR